MVDIRSKPFDLSEAQADWVRQTLAGMSTQEKAGQLFCVMGQDYDPETLRQMTAQGRIGGILFRPEPAERIRSRYAPLDAAARIPLLKAANLEEGGTGGLSDGTLFGWPMLTAATDDLQTAERFGRVCAVEGRSVGINWTFSPVCDIDMNFRNPITNVRTFGSDPERVRAMAARYVETVQGCGMAACAKHFPGDGVDYRDQHLHPTYNSLPAAQWYATYGAIYQELIGRGLMSVMVGHIVQPSVAMEINPALRLEDCLPASLSPELLTGVLRGRLGFNGVITSDATIMGGYCMAMERRRAIPASIAAGCDMLVFNTDFEEDYRYLLAGIEDGTVSLQRLDDAVTRILALKARVCFAPPCRETAEGAAWRREAAERAVTLVKNNRPQILPVTPQRYPDIRLIVLGRDSIAEGSVTQIAKALLEAQGFAVEVYTPMEDELHGTAALSGRRLTLYLANYEQASNQATVRVNWCPKHALDTPRFLNEEPCVFVSLANPYLLQDVPRVPVYINAYTASRAVIKAVIDKLLRGGPFEGISPVDAFCGLPDTRL
ncbi:MAG: glycosyl hydrolase family 3 [Clostridiales bacterium]|nr:glycosyl hydrolase family 3 [Clostridiales bacterium]